MTGMSNLQLIADRLDIGTLKLDGDLYIFVELRSSELTNLLDFRG